MTVNFSRRADTKVWPQNCTDRAQSEAIGSTNRHRAKSHAPEAHSRQDSSMQPIT